MSNRNQKESNKGAGLISVIVAVAFVTILGSIIISATLSNYRMKQTNLETKDSFYNAERALDEVRMGLQGVVSQALSNSYLKVMENYATYDLETKQDLMESVFFETIWTSLAENAATHTTYQVNKLSSYLVETAWTGADMANGYGAILSSDSNLMMSYDNEGVVLKNLKVYYRDQKGFVSMITTDIKLVIPDLQFSSGYAMTNIAEYSMIADTGLVTATSGMHEINGSLYAGRMDLPGDQSLANTTGRLAMIIESADTIVVKDGIEVANADFTAENSAIWTKDLIGNSSNLKLGGTINVKNDLTIEGTGTTATLKGIYNGYGNNLIQSDESSAILINGKDATLNLQETSVLTLAGHAFVGTKNRSVGGVGGTGKDIFTGESITVKSNQLMYLVPAECIGVSYSTVNGSKLVGKSVYGRNPLTASAAGGATSPYGELSSHPELYDMIADGIIPQKLGFPLSKYLKYVAGVPQVEKVFVQTNGETLVYFYMSFQDENAANQYFKDYYALNTAKILEYTDFYTNGIVMKDPAFMLRLQLAGNATKYDGTTTSVQSNTLTNGSAKLSASNVTASGSFDALCTKLAFQYSELSNLQETDLSQNIVFDNIVDIPNLKNFMTTNDSYCNGIPKSYSFGTGTSKALITDNALTDAYHYTGTTDVDVHVIIATGDVVVDADFTGLILTDGTITLSNGVSLSANQELVREALESSVTLDGVTWNVIGFLRDGSDLLNLIGSTSDQDNETAIGQLVVYENWSKN